jgi:hypothetical protein
MPVNIMSIMIQSSPRKAHNSTVSGSFAHTPSAVRPDCMHSSMGFLGAIVFAPSVRTGMPPAKLRPARARLDERRRYDSFGSSSAKMSGR